MGHSVRGYEPPQGHPDWVEGSGDSGYSGYGLGGWDAIKSGKAKVYSLVDSKGEPHATIEVGKNTYAPRWDDVKKYMAAAEEEAKKKAEEESKKRAAIRSGEKAGLASLSFFERKAAERLAKKLAQQKK
jgi:hypothetical protein